MSELHAPAPNRRRATQRGMSIIELLIVMGIIGIIAKIAIPNLKVALSNSQQRAACNSIHQIDVAIQQYAAEKNNLPNTITSSSLVELVQSGDLTQRQARGILNTLEGNQIWWYFQWYVPGYPNYYMIGFRPKHGNTNYSYFLYPDSTIWRYDYPNSSWTQLD